MMPIESVDMIHELESGDGDRALTAMKPAKRPLRSAAKELSMVSSTTASKRTEPPPEAAKLRKLYGRTSTVDWSKCLSVERKPGTVSGAWVFKRTRVPVSALWENLEGGSNLNQFANNFPGITRKHLLDVIEFLLYSLEQEPRLSMTRTPTTR